MAKEITFTIGERLAAIGILNAFKGDLSQLVVLMDDIKKFAISETEWKVADLKKTPTGDGKETWQWTDTEKQAKKIELATETAAYILAQIKEKSDKKELTLADAALLTLKKKLE